MSTNTHAIPTRKGPSGLEIETRPIYIEEWLDSLPYVDFAKTSKLLLDATTATNKVDIKPEARLELVQLYNRPYSYYLQSQIKAGAHHTLQSIETMQGQANILKRIAINLAFSSKKGFELLQNKKTLWRQSKPPLPAILMSLNYLSHALIFSFLEYSPTPKNVWREINDLYKFAEDIAMENNSVVPLGADSNEQASTIADSYVKIAMATLVDPYHLPFGAVWEIYSQLQGWSNYSEFRLFERVTNSEGYFVVNLDEDSQPVAYSKFDATKATSSHRLINANALNSVVKKNMDLLNRGSKLDDSVILSPFYTKTILTQMSRAWGLPPKRYTPRDKLSGKTYLTFGLDSIFYHINNKTDLESTFVGVDKDVIIAQEQGGDFSDDTKSTRLFPIESWNLVDQGPGGFAVTKDTKPRCFVRVGDLVGISQTMDDNQETKLALGVVRWLMISQSDLYRIGIQTIAADIVPVVIKALSGEKHEIEPKRGIIAGEYTKDAVNDIITTKGLYRKNREFEVTIDGKIINGEAANLKESSQNFEHFTVKL